MVLGQPEKQLCAGEKTHRSPSRGHGDTGTQLQGDKRSSTPREAVQRSGSSSPPGAKEPVTATGGKVSFPSGPPRSNRVGVLGRGPKSRPSSSCRRVEGRAEYPNEGKVSHQGTPGFPALGLGFLRPYSAVLNSVLELGLGIRPLSWAQAPGLTGH